MTDSAKSPDSDTKLVKKPELPESVLFLYQPQGLEDCVTGAKLVAWEVIDTTTASGRRIVTTSIARGINLVSYEYFQHILEDPECYELFRKRSLVKICDGSNPFANRSEPEGVYGSVSSEMIIERTFRKDLLEGWENWLKQQNWDKDKSQNYGDLLQQVRDRIIKIDSLGKSIRPSYNPDFPDSVATNSRLQIV